MDGLLEGWLGSFGDCNNVSGHTLRDARFLNNIITKSRKIRQKVHRDRTNICHKDHIVCASCVIAKMHMSKCTLMYVSPSRTPSNSNELQITVNLPKQGEGVVGLMVGDPCTGVLTLEHLAKIVQNPGHIDDVLDIVLTQREVLTRLFPQGDRISVST